MSAFRDKSKHNFTASQVLQKNEHRLHDSGIHCAYYACVQELLHIIFNKLKITKEQFDQDRRANKDGTHGWAFKLIGLEVAKKDRQDFKWFQRAFPELKQLREDADYSEKISGSNESNKATRLATDIVSMLVKLFK